MISGRTRVIILISMKFITVSGREEGRKEGRSGKDEEKSAMQLEDFYFLFSSFFVFLFPSFLPSFSIFLFSSLQFLYYSFPSLTLLMHCSLLPLMNVLSISGAVSRRKK